MALAEQSTSKTKGTAAHEAVEALTSARARQEEARRLYELKCEETAEAETMFNSTLKDILEKAEALEEHVKAVARRTESLGTTEEDFFFNTLLDRQEEAQTHLNDLSVQLSQQHTTIRPTH